MFGSCEFYVFKEGVNALHRGGISSISVIQLWLIAHYSAHPHFLLIMTRQAWLSVDLGSKRSAKIKRDSFTTERVRDLEMKVKKSELGVKSSPKKNPKKEDRTCPWCREAFIYPFAPEKAPQHFPRLVVLQTGRVGETLPASFARSIHLCGI